jgi:ion channel-forming bestrophin family protein
MIVRQKKNSLSLLFAWQGTILPKVLPTLIVVMFISAALVFLTQIQYLNIPRVPAIGFTIFGVILSIFLSFRNNACYDRWWEGRKLWGALIATTRDLTRDSHVLDEALRRRSLYRMMLFSHLLRDRLRHQQHPFLYEKGVEFNSLVLNHLSTQVNAPQWVLEQIQKDLVAAYKQGEMTDIIYQSLTQHTIGLGHIQAGCERILTTPLPFAYSVLLHRAVYSFCFILPFSLEASLGLWTPILVGLITYLFLGLDALSEELEEPFGLQPNDLALDSIVRVVERETLASLGEEIPSSMELKGAQMT